jgi:hypothetical protein
MSLSVLLAQHNDVTVLDIDDLADEYGFHPSTSIEQGIS